MCILILGSKGDKGDKGQAGPQGFNGKKKKIISRGAHAQSFIGKTIKHANTNRC